MTTMSDLYRPQALASMSSALDERPRVQLLPPRRWLVAGALVVVLIAGVIFIAVTSVVAPARGVGFLDQGGFVTLRAPVNGTLLAGFAMPGSRIKKGDELVRLRDDRGNETPVLSPTDAVVMQILVPGRGWSVAANDEIYVLAGIDSQSAPTVIMLLPGAQAGAFSAGDIAKGASAWLEPAGQPAIQCQVVQVDPYALSAEQVNPFIPDPMVKEMVAKMGSVQYAGAECPPDAIANLLPGMPIPVSVSIRQDSLLSFIFGRS